MGDGPPGFRRDFTCPAVLRIHFRGNEVSTTGLLPSMTGLSRPLRLLHSFLTLYKVSYNPKRQASWFGLFPVRSPLLRESMFLSLPLGTKMFQFPRSAFHLLWIQRMDTVRLRTVGFPIRKSPDQCLLTAPRSISVLVPSFIGS